MFLNGDITLKLYKSYIKSDQCFGISIICTIYLKRPVCFKIFLVNILVVFLSRTFRCVQSRLQCLRTLVGTLPVFWSTKDTPYSSLISNSTQGFALFTLWCGQPVATVATLALRAFIYLHPEKKWKTERNRERVCVVLRLKTHERS